MTRFRAENYSNSLENSFIYSVHSLLGYTSVQLYTY